METTFVPPNDSKKRSQSPTSSSSTQLKKLKLSSHPTENGKSSHVSQVVKISPGSYKLEKFVAKLRAKDKHAVRHKNEPAHLFSLQGTIFIAEFLLQSIGLVAHNIQTT
jgi:hypothetical protein